MDKTNELEDVLEEEAVDEEFLGGDTSFKNLMGGVAKETSKAMALELMKVPFYAYGVSLLLGDVDGKPEKQKSIMEIIAKNIGVDLSNKKEAKAFNMLSSGDIGLTQEDFDDFYSRHDQKKDLKGTIFDPETKDERSGQNLQELEEALFEKTSKTDQNVKDKKEKVDQYLKELGVEPEEKKKQGEQKQAIGQEGSGVEPEEKKKQGEQKQAISQEELEKRLKELEEKEKALQEREKKLQEREDKLKNDQNKEMSDNKQPKQEAEAKKKLSPKTNAPIKKVSIKDTQARDMDVRQIREGLEEMYKQLNDADPVTMRSSKEFKTMKEDLKETLDYMKDVNRRNKADHIPKDTFTEKQQKSLKVKFARLKQYTTNYLNKKGREFEEVSATGKAFSERAEKRVQAAEKLRDFMTESRAQLRQNLNNRIPKEAFALNDAHKKMHNALEKIKQERAQKAKEKQEKEQQERERKAKEKEEKEKARKEKEQQEKERKAKEKQEKEQQEKERKEKARLEKEEKEKARKEKEQQEKERKAKEKLEKAQKEKEQKEKKQQEKQPLTQAKMRENAQKSIEEKLKNQTFDEASNGKRNMAEIFSHKMNLSVIKNYKGAMSQKALDRMLDEKNMQKDIETFMKSEGFENYFKSLDQEFVKKCIEGPDQAQNQAKFYDDAVKFLDGQSKEADKQREQNLQKQEEKQGPVNENPNVNQNKSKDEQKLEDQGMSMGVK